MRLSDSLHLSEERSKAREAVPPDLAGLVLPEPMTERERLGEGGRASFVLQPLERGFGHTIGNLMRRIMLSSLPGAAVWAFRADGVQHEHQTLDRVAEDIHQIIQNLKRLVLVIDDEDADEAKLELSVHKAGPVTARQIAKHGSVNVVNPDLLLFSLQEDLPKKRPLKLDMWVNRGRGFVMADQHANPRDGDHGQSLPLGTIRIDSVYNPVLRANFSVRETRVGQRTDFDRLEVDVETNGAVDPVEAVSQASAIAQFHLAYFGDISSEGDPTTESAGDEIEEHGMPPVDPSMAALFRSSLSDFSDISARTRNTLERHGISTLADVVSRTRDGMLALDSFGEKSLEEVAEVLAQKKLSFGMAVKRDDQGNFYLMQDPASDGSADDEDEA